MPERKPENFLEVLFKSASAGVGTAAREIVPAGQQQKQNALAELSAVMQFDSQQRATVAHDQRIALGRLNLQKVNKELTKLGRLPYEVGKERGLEDLGRAQAVLGGLGDIPQLPVGGKLDIGPLQLSNIESGFNLNEFLLGKLGEKRFTEFKTETGEFAPPVTPTKTTERDKTFAFYKERYSPELFSQIELFVRGGGKFGKSARDAYAQTVRLNTPKGQFGAFQNDINVQIAAAKETGYSPVFGMTRLEKKMELEDRLAVGDSITNRAGKVVSITKENFPKLLLLIDKHYDNLEEAILKHAEQ